VLARTGAQPEAAEAYRVAIGLSTDDAVRAYLRGKLALLTSARSG
jgi:predicted RNA polymerase sigma factor